MEFSRVNVNVNVDAYNWTDRHVRTSKLKEERVVSSSTLTKVTYYHHVFVVSVLELKVLLRAAVRHQ